MYGRNSATVEVMDDETTNLRMVDSMGDLMAEKEEKLSRPEAVAKALRLCKEAVQSLTNATATVGLHERAADMSLGAARSYIEEVYGLLEKIRLKATVPEGQKPDDEGFKA